MRDDDLLIQVPESEYEPLLHRDAVLSDMNQHLAPWTKQMRDIVNYGTSLIPRCFGTSSRSFADAVIVGILLRQVVTMLDGTEILLSNGAVHAAKLQMRALWEATIYIQWVLLGDIDKKADYYYVHNLRRQRQWCENVQGSSLTGREFADTMNALGVPTRQEAIDIANKQLPEINSTLSKPRFAQINAAFDMARRGKNDVAWHAPLGPKTLRQMAKDLGRLAEYMLVYSNASEVMHGSNYRQHVELKPGHITFTPIRYPVDFGVVYQFSVTFTFSTYRRILEKYRPGELPAFSRKYLEKWRKHFMNIPKITINSSNTTI